MPQAHPSAQVEQTPATAGAQSQENKAGRANNAVLCINETEQVSEDLFDHLTAQNSIIDPLHASSILPRSLICGIDSAAAACRAPTSNIPRQPSP
jgi:hypothetical protein